MKYSKVVGIGLNKTGTSTLADCFHILGYRVCPEIKGYKMKHPGIRFPNLADRYNAFEDFPWYLPDVYQSFSNRQANTAFILTNREVNRWFCSLKRWAISNVVFPCRQLYLGIGLKHFSELEEKEEEIKQDFLDHNEQARKFFDNKSNFLEADWEAGDGWKELCNFLELPNPNCTFPHRLRYNPEAESYTD